MDQNNPLLLFLQELVKRLVSKSPKFFKILQWITALTSVITGLPGFLAKLSIHLPAPWDALANQTVAVAAAVAWLIAKLPVQSPAIAVTQDGVLLKKADDKSIPFTEQTEKKTALQNGLATSSTLKEVIDAANK